MKQITLNRAVAEQALEAMILGVKPSDRGPLFIDAITTLRQALMQASACGEAEQQEPMWTLKECKKVIDTLKYIQGIAERGEGRAMRDDESLDQFVLGYVKKLEKTLPAPQPVQAEPVLWIHPETFAMNSAHVGAWKPGHELEGYIPLYIAPPPTGGNAIRQMQRDEAPATDVALLRQALEFMNELLPPTNEISANHLSDPTVLRDAELRDTLRQALEAEQRTWVGLTDEEIATINKEAARGSAIRRDGTTSRRIARAVEAKLKEKNHG